MMVPSALLVTLAVLVSTCLGDLGDQLDTTDLSDANAATALFQAWKTEYHITFDTAEQEAKASDTWLANANKIQNHRKEHKKGKHTYNLGLNKFSYLTYDEFKSTRLGNIKSIRDSQSILDAGAYRRKRATLPSSLNYTAQGYVTPVKDQGQCGCCWSFTTTGVLEGAYSKKYGKLLSFSEQQLVECFQTYMGCDGGVPADAVNYIKSIGGIASETNYPYTSQAGTYGACKGSLPLTPMAPMYTDIPTDDTSLMNALVTNGPVAVSVAVGDLFMSYTTGIIDPNTACTPPINHDVLLVGYGTDATNKLSYWLVKNSWNTDWGEKGYFRLNRAITNSCGVNENSISVNL